MKKAYICIILFCLLSCTTTVKKEQDQQQTKRSVLLTGEDYFLGIWTQVADENGKTIPASKIPIKIRITKPEGFFYFVEVSFDNEAKYLSMPGDGIYEKFGFTLRNRKLSHTTLEFKHDMNDPNGDYLYEEGGSGFFKKLQN